MDTTIEKSSAREAITPELQARIDQSREQIRNGDCTVIRSREELHAYLTWLSSITSYYTSTSPMLHDDIWKGDIYRRMEIISMTSSKDKTSKSERK